MAILWDEIEPQQVLKNKLVFQSGLEPVTMQQRACNGFSYNRWLFQTPTLLCSNKFNLSSTIDTPLSAEDTQWVGDQHHSRYPPAGGKWYMAKTPEAIPELTQG